MIPVKHMSDNKQILIPPFRVGKKQGRAVLDSLGHEIVIFSPNQEHMAQEYCDFLNNHHASVGHEDYEKALDEIARLQKKLDECEKYINNIER